ncbi:MAG: PilZ domain-containing protein, partial [Mariprofundus sp.]
MQAALLHAKEILMQPTLDQILSLPEPRRHKEFLKIFLHLDRAQASLLKVVEANWRDKFRRLQSRLQEASKEQMLNETYLTWQQEGEVEFYNFYNELPILARVPLRSIRDNVISVTRTDELDSVLTAGEHRRYAHVRLPHSEQCLRMYAEGASGNVVRWHEAGIMQIAKNKRLHIRVQCKEPISLTLNREHGPKWDACLRDFSATGLGLSHHDRLPGDVDDILICDFRLEQRSVHVKGRICWKIREGSNTRLGLKLMLDHKNTQVLQSAAAQRQLRIIKELKMLGPPDCLL